MLPPAGLFLKTGGDEPKFLSAGRPTDEASSRRFEPNETVSVVSNQVGNNFVSNQGPPIDAIDIIM